MVWKVVDPSVSNDSEYIYIYIIFFIISPPVQSYSILLNLIQSYWIWFNLNQILIPFLVSVWVVEDNFGSSIALMECQYPSTPICQDEESRAVSSLSCNIKHGVKAGHDLQITRCLGSTLESHVLCQRQLTWPQWFGISRDQYANTTT